jgi:hypothetical protein
MDNPVELKELLEAVATMPNGWKLKGPLFRLAGSLNRKRRILSLVQDALAQLRLDLKYLLFDLEATRRERDEYKQRLET